MQDSENRIFERRPVLNAAVDIAPPEQIVAHLVEAATARRGCSVVGISAPYATAMGDDAQFREAFLQADLLIPDGKGFTWGARLLGVPCGERIAIPDLCDRLLAEGNARGWKVFLYGATEEVNGKACAALRERYPALAGVEGLHGYHQGPAEEDAVIERLRAGGFNLLIVARPSPDKERFLARCCSAAGVVGLAAGGYADILAGKTRRAPAAVQALGMEWLFRVLQEPRRLWKRVGWANARFAAAAMWAHLRMPSERAWWGSAPLHVAVIVLAICAAYAGTLHAPYHFDDPEYIQDNPTIRSFDHLREIKVLSFRKLWWYSNAICYRLSELYGNHRPIRPDVRIFRAWNIGCQLIAALALYGLLRRVLRASERVRPGEGGTAYDLAAAVGATIFAAHPLCTESVTYISGRDNGQGGMFYLLGLYAAAVAFGRIGTGNTEDTPSVSSGAKAPPSPHGGEGKDPSSCALPQGQGGTAAALLDKPAVAQRPQGEGEPLRWPAWLWPVTWTVIFGACSVLTKESHLLFPLAVALVYAFFYRGTQPRLISTGLLLGVIAAMGALAWGAAGRREGRLGIALQLIVLALAAGAVFGRQCAASAAPRWRAFLQQRLSVNWAIFATAAGMGAASIVAFPYAYQRLLAALTGEMASDYVRSLSCQAHAVPWMLLRTVAPLGLNIDHDFPSISDPNDPRVWQGALIITALLAFGLIGLWRRWLGGFGVLLALVVIAPTNTVIERGDVVSERNFYLAAAGGACLIAWALSAALAWLGTRAAEQVRREADDAATGEDRARSALQEAGLWTAVLGFCIAAPFTALTVLRNNEWGDAYRLWASAHARSPAKLRVLYNYGLASYMTKRYDEADAAFTSLIAIGEAKAEQKLFRPDETVQVKCFHLGYNMLATVQLRRHLAKSNTPDLTAFKRVDELYRRGIERTAYDPDLAYTYAQFLLQLGRTTDTAAILQHSLNLHPWAEHLCYPLGLAYLENGQFDAARDYLERALNVRDQHTLGVAVEMRPEQRAEILAYLGLARLYKKQRVEAKNAWRDALDVDHGGIVMMLTTLSRTRNPKLKPVQSNPPDALVTALTQTRRDVLEVLYLACDELLNREPRRERTIPKMLRTMADNELRRRGAYQKKRLQFGFLDDPDAE